MTLALESLTVRGFRGIPGTETFTFGGENVVVVGPNGSGKSTLGQALEFLLSGKIGALSGEATGRIRAQTHIPNRRADPADVFVEATFTDDGRPPFRVRREFTSRSRLQAERRPDELQTLVALSKRGLLQLTRAQLLDLVVATPGDRKEQLQSLLELDEIDERRRQLKRLARKADDEAERQERDRESAEERLQSSLDVEAVDHVTVETAVNRLRRELGGEPIDDVETTDSFREGIASPAEQASNPLQSPDVQRALRDMEAWLNENATRLHELRTSFAETVVSLQSDRDTLARLSELELVRRGQELVGADTTVCPLCRADWERGELESRLDERRRRLTRIEDRVNELKRTATEFTELLDEARDLTDRLRDRLDNEAVGTTTTPLATFAAELDELADACAHDPAEEVDEFPVETLEARVDTDGVQDCVTSLLEEAETLPDGSVLQNAWDELGAASEAYHEYRTAEHERRVYRHRSEELDTAHGHFLQARDEVLGGVYDEISTRFEELYTQINPDEGGIGSALSPTDTGVELSVSFYDDDEDHPPHALHSEGHQDSMGVCLFLALAEHFSPLDHTPVVLDDVVMSVNRDHRGRLAELLVDDLSDHFQFVLTTHDEQWARELRNRGFVNDANVVAFGDWSPVGGPERTTL